MICKPSRSYRFGAFLLDAAEHQLVRSGRPVRLRPKVFELLCVLVENAGHLVDKEQLLREVWSDAFVEESNLNRAISVLRKALGESPAERYIETVPKRGYRFVADVREVERETPVRQPREWGTRIAVAAGAVLTLAAISYVLFSRTPWSGDPAESRTALHRQLTFTGRELTPSLSPDGGRVAYVSNESPHRRLLIQGVGGGSPIEVFSGPEIGGLRWSPDGSNLMFWARGEGTDGVHVASASGAGGHRTISRTPFVACWSPDGSTIALALFVARKIMFVSKSGQTQHSIALTETRGWIWDLDWSVDGGLLFVTDDSGQRPAVWTIQPDGTGQKNVFTSASKIFAARWAASADAFYYFSRVNQTASVYKASLTPDRGGVTGAPVQLLSGLETDEGFGLSADGTRLVYARSPYYSNLWIVAAGAAANGEPPRQRQLTSGTAVIERPRVSPDGKTILFSMGYESRADLYTLPVAGGVPTQLTSLDAFSLGGVWSPDGRSIAFGSDKGGTLQVWVVNTNGSSPRPLRAAELSESFDLAWAPGTRLLYQQTGNRNYGVLGERTTGDRSLVRDGSVGWINSTAYSPDGTLVAVGWNRPPNRGLWVIDSRSRRERLIHTLHADSDAVPIGWAPDGNAIYALDGKRAAYRGPAVPYELTVTQARIIRVPLSGQPPEKMVSLPFDEIGSVTPLPDGRQFLCTVYSSRSDVWIVENFDRARSPATVTRLSQ